LSEIKSIEISKSATGRKSSEYGAREVSVADGGSAEAHQDVEVGLAEAHRDVEVGFAEAHQDAEVGFAEAHQDAEVGFAEANYGGEVTTEETNYGVELAATGVSLALVHWPVLDRAGAIVATNVTNFDVHDIARAGRTYGIDKYVIIHRAQEQLMFVHRLLDHWRVGRGAKFNPKRRTALNQVKTSESLEQALNLWPQRPIVIATAARALPEAPAITFRELRERIEKDPKAPILLLFGTGCGLSEDVLKCCDYLLEPISGSSRDNYRHLSVRSAVSICLDRLLGAW
jgi:hypothetical protein